MLELSTLFLVSFIVSITIIKLYRLIASRQGFSQVTVANPGKTKKRLLKPQQRFNSLGLSTRGHAKYTTLSNSKGGIKAPWGW